jgi:hypothetical protein
MSKPRDTHLPRIPITTPLMCRTGGSPDPATRYVIAEFGNGAERECPSDWHIPNTDDA